MVIDNVNPFTDASAQERRTLMVERQIVARGITDPLVLKAMVATG